MYMTLIIISTQKHLARTGNSMFMFMKTTIPQILEMKTILTP